jgi:DNA-directed RNA polymerase subunit omega
MFNAPSDKLIEECLEQIPSRFHVALIGAYRARQITQGHAIKAQEEDITKFVKNTSIAMVEMGSGLISMEMMDKVSDAQ